MSKRYRSAVTGEYVTEAEAKADPARTVGETSTNERRADMGDNFEAAFNKWMDDCVNAPEDFQAMSEVARQHLNQRLDGLPPTYGDVQAATFREYLRVV